MQILHKQLYEILKNEKNIQDTDGGGVNHPPPLFRLSCTAPHYAWNSGYIEKLTKKRNILQLYKRDKETLIINIVP